MEPGRSKAPGDSGTSRLPEIPPAPVRPHDRILHGDAYERAGVLGTYKTTLTEWIQLLQMGRRDAVLSVRTDAGREATLWCRGGDIIDAACDGLTGVDAFYRALSWKMGKVSVAFGGFDHQRSIKTSTTGLLLGAMLRRDGGKRESERDDPDGFSDAALADLPSREPPPVTRRRSPKLVFGAVGVLLAVALLVGGVSKRTVPTHSDQAAPEMSAPTFVARVDVEPVHAAISLDDLQVGVGRFAKTLPRDGRTHHIVCSAPGYVSAILVFRDTPPRQRVTLALNEQAMAARGPFPVEIRPPPMPVWAPPAEARSVMVRRHAVVARVRPRTGAASPRQASTGAIERAVSWAPEKVNVQLIDASPPRVQIIDERQPHVRIIDDRQLRIDVVQ